MQDMMHFSRRKGEKYKAFQQAFLSCLVQFVLPKVKGADAVCLQEIANYNCSCSIAPEKAVQKVSLLLACCIPDLQSVQLSHSAYSLHWGAAAPRKHISCGI